MTEQCHDWLASACLPKLQKLAFASVVAGSRPLDEEAPAFILALKRLTALSLQLANTLIMAVGQSVLNTLRWPCRTQ